MFSRSWMTTRDHFQESFIPKIVDNLFLNFLYALFVSRETVRPQTQLQEDKIGPPTDSGRGRI